MTTSAPPTVDAVDLLEELLHIDSATPAGGGPGEAALAERLVSILAGFGCEASLLDGADAESDAGRQAPASEPPPTEAEPADVFAAAWPVLARHLREPVGERDFAERTGLEPKQARVWLTRALDEGLVELLPRPKRYVLCAEARGQLHFEKPKGDP